MFFMGILRKCFGRRQPHGLVQAKKLIFNTSGSAFSISEFQQSH